MSCACRTLSKLTALGSRQRGIIVNSYSSIYSPITSPFTITKFAGPRSVLTASLLSSRCISVASQLRKTENTGETPRQTNQKDQDAQEENVRADIGIAAKQQIRRPWQREGADEPPVSQNRKDLNKSMGNGKLLTTPTRLLKLILPLPVDALHDEQGNKGEYRAIAQNEDIQPLALLVHPQQPLSYLERLIQAELPPVRDLGGREKVPTVYFLAEGSERDEAGRKRGSGSGTGPKGGELAGAGVDDTGSGLGHLGADTPPEHKDWVRWSSSTEVGDFIRDAAKGREFVIEIDGLNAEIRVGVPSFGDRTHYMRMRLRRMSRRIEQQARIKHECDLLAHRGAHRLAKAGFGVLTAWWATVYFVTFHTDAGWDLVEPVTVHLAGLTTIMGGYLWFLFISRDLSYQAALKITVSRRQNVLYQARGFDAQQWETLVQDANTLRHEIRTVAEEYDVEWDEARDLGGEEVVEVLEKEEDRRKKGRGSDKDDESDAAEGNNRKKDNKEAKADPKRQPEGK